MVGKGGYITFKGSHKYTIGTADEELRKLYDVLIRQKLEKPVFLDIVVEYTTEQNATATLIITPNVATTITIDTGVISIAFGTTEILLDDDGELNFPVVEA